MKNNNSWLAWRKKQSETYKIYIKTSAVGLEFALSIAIGALVGYYIDKRFGFSPYALIIGFIIGSLAGAKRLWVFGKSYVEEAKKEELKQQAQENKKNKKNLDVH